MKYNRSNHYDKHLIQSKIMGPNPIKLEEELLSKHKLFKDAVVMDLGCGHGITSIFLVKEYGFRVFSVDLWSNPSDNKRFFDEMGFSSKQIIPLKGDAASLPFAEEFFDGIVSIDSYHYFGRDKNFLKDKLLPLLKHGGYLYIAVPGMKKDLHEALPPELLLFWTKEDLDTIHDCSWWRSLIEKTPGIEILSIHEMESNEEVWKDWLACDNKYARGDRRIFEAGGGKYLNFIAIILKRL